MTITHMYNRGKLSQLRAYQAPKKLNPVQKIINMDNFTVVALASFLAVFTLAYYNII